MKIVLFSIFVVLGITEMIAGAPHHGGTHNLHEVEKSDDRGRLMSDEQLSDYDRPECTDEWNEYKRLNHVAIPPDEWMDDCLSKCKTSSGPRTGSPCIFPFKYENVEYKSCTSVDNNNVLWCPTTVNANQEYVSGLWGNCSAEVPPQS